MLSDVRAPRRWPFARPQRAPLLASMLAADPLQLGAQAAQVAQAGVDALHIDVMDGHFVPNLAFSPAQVQALSRHSPLPLDVHLMLADPLAWIDRFAEAGAFGITLHVEALRDPVAALRRLSAAGVAPGLSVKPNTDVGALLDALGEHAKHLSMLLIMSVAPGFGGQAFDPAALTNLERAARHKRATGADFVIEVDGGVNEQTIAQAAGAGAEAFVVGTALLGAPDWAARAAALRARL